MKVVKFLERPNVIRFFGTCLIFAPFINIATDAYLHSLKSEVTWQIIKSSLLIGTFAQNMQNALSIGSLIIGLIMIKGSTRAWSFVLLLIGLQIVIQGTTLIKDFKESPFWGVLFVVNIALFFFIADQLVIKTIPSTEPQITKSKGPISKTPLSATAKPLMVTRKRIFIHLLDANSWVQILNISPKGILAKSMQKDPITFSQKTMIVFLSHDLHLHLALDHLSGDQLFFKFLNLTPGQTKKLNQFIISKSEIPKKDIIINSTSDGIKAS